jgi:hypothetical protein
MQLTYYNSTISLPQSAIGHIKFHTSCTSLSVLLSLHYVLIYIDRGHVPPNLKL